MIVIILWIIIQSVLSVSNPDKHGLQLFITNTPRGLISHPIDVPLTATIQDLIDAIAETIDININDETSLIRPKHSGLDLLKNNDKDYLLSDLGICAESSIDFDIIDISPKLDITVYDKHKQIMFSKISKIKCISDPQATKDNTYTRKIHQQYGHEWKFFSHDLCNIYKDVLIENMNLTSKPFGVSIERKDRKRKEMVFKFNLNDCDKDTRITRLLLLNPIDTDLVIPTNVSVKENYYSSNIDIRSLSIEIIIE